MSTDPDEFEPPFTTAQAAGILGRSQKTISDECAAGIITGTRVPSVDADDRPTAWLIPRAVVRQLIRQQEATARRLTGSTK